MARTNPPADNPTPPQSDDAAVAARLGVSADQIKGLDLSVFAKLLALGAQYAPVVLALVNEIVESWRRLPKQATPAAGHGHDEALAASAHEVAVAACETCCAAWHHAAACGHDHTH